MGSQVDDGNTEGRYMIETERLYIQSLDVDENLHDFHDMWKDPRLVTTTPRPAHVTIESTQFQLLSRLPTPLQPWRFHCTILSKAHPSLKPPSSISPTSDTIATSSQVFKPRLIGTIGLSYHSLLAPPTAECELSPSEIQSLNLQWTEDWRNDNDDTSPASETPISQTRYLEIGYGFHPSFQSHGYGSEALPAFLQHFWTMSRFSDVQVLAPRTGTENIASMKLLRRCGAKRWAVLKDGIEVPVRGGQEGEMRWEDVGVWVLGRPGVLG